MVERALTGVKVIELCNMVAGPFCAKIMADMGAEVIKVERPGLGDESRRRSPFPGDVPHMEKSGLFLYLNTNKLGVTLNLEAKKGRAIFKELVSKADILVEDNPPGMLAGLGLGYEALKDPNPRLIMTSITPFGQSGPYKDYKAYPLNSFHSSGEGYVNPMATPFPDRAPVKLGRFSGEYEAGIYAALGTVLALYFQRAIGVGQQVDISKQEALTISCLVDHNQYTSNGMVVTRLGRRWQEAGVMPCKDGYAQFFPAEATFWPRLARLMGNPEWTESDIYNKLELRRQHAAEVRKKLEEWTITRSKHEIQRGALEEGLAASACLTPKEIMQSELLKSRGFFAQLEHPEAGKITHVTAPYRLSRSPWRAERAAPLLGEHNEQVYGQRLGYGRQELVRLRGLGVI